MASNLIWLEYDYNELDSNWLELDSNIEDIDDICFVWFGII